MELLTCAKVCGGAGTALGTNPKRLLPALASYDQAIAEQVASLCMLPVVTCEGLILCGL